MYSLLDMCMKVTYTYWELNKLFLFTALFKYNITSVEIKNASFKVRHTFHYLSEWGSLKRENKQMKKKKLLTMWKTVQKMGIKKRERFMTWKIYVYFWLGKCFIWIYNCIYYMHSVGVSQTGTPYLVLLLFTYVIWLNWNPSHLCEDCYTCVLVHLKMPFKAFGSLKCHCF